MRNSVTVTLPSGLRADGELERELALRALSGEDEAFLLEAGDSLLPAYRVTHLLARCAAHVGSTAPLSAKEARSLTVGDREALLLQLRRLVFGDRLRCNATCQAPDCGETLEWNLRVSDLLQPPVGEPKPVHEATIEENGSNYRVRFRLPTGADQEAAALLARGHLNEGAGLLLQRCIESVRRTEDDGLLEDCPPAIAERVGALMADLDPQAELTVNLTCPACGLTFAAVFDAADYLFRELRDSALTLYREVHTLAMHYHWSESEIMGMPPRKRRRYLDLLLDALGEGGQS